jgi:hypothetical protein
MLIATFATALFIVVLFIVVLSLIPRRRDILNGCEGLISKLEPYDLESLSRFVSDEFQADKDKEFWKASNGVQGLWNRWRKMMLTVRIVQWHYRANSIETADALHIWKMAVLYTWFSLWSIPEAALSRAFTSIPHVAARTALSVYCAIAIRAVNLCVTEDAPVCIMQMRKLL